MMKLKKTAIVAVSALALTVSACKANNTDTSSKGAKLVMKALHGQGTITQSFSVNSSLEGFVIKPLSGGQGMVLFAQKDGSYLFAGNLIDADGKNLTQEYTQKYVYSALAKGAEQGLANTHYLVEGSNSAKHKMYVFFDPNCSACHVFYDDVAPMVKSGDVQVRWVPVAFRAPSSIGKAAHILSGKTEGQKAGLLQIDENKFDMQTETGGLSVLKKNSSNAKYFQQVKDNTDFFAKKSFYATPTIIFKDASGKTQVITGAPPKGPHFDALIDKVSHRW